jgi:hypothetical protein
MVKEKATVLAARDSVGGVESAHKRVQLVELVELRVALQRLLL